jgi:hypothetical protein
MDAEAEAKAEDDTADDNVDEADAQDVEDEEEGLLEVVAVVISCCNRDGV